jgi:YggT family protein
MFGDITRFLLDTIFSLFGAALLLRAWTQAVRLSPRNPLSQAIFQLTGWRLSISSCWWRRWA